MSPLPGWALLLCPGCDSKVTLWWLSYICLPRLSPGILFSVAFGGIVCCCRNIPAGPVHSLPSAGAARGLPNIWNSWEMPCVPAGMAVPVNAPKMMWLSCRGQQPAARGYFQRYKPGFTAWFAQLWANHRDFRALGWERVTPRRAEKGTAGTGAPRAALVVPLSSKAWPWTEAPWGLSWASPRSCWAAEPARKASVPEVLHISPRCSLGFPVWVCPRAAALFGVSRGRAVFQAVLGCGGGCGVLTSSLEGSPIPGHGPGRSQECGQAGNCKSFRVRRWAGAPGCSLLPAKASAVLHAPLPLPCSISWRCLV